MNLRGAFYRSWSRLIHRFNYHHCTVCYPDGEIQDWCQWCGLRMTRPNVERAHAALSEEADIPRVTDAERAEAQRVREGIVKP